MIATATATAPARLKTPPTATTIVTDRPQVGGAFVVRRAGVAWAVEPAGTLARPTDYGCTFGPINGREEPTSTEQPPEDRTLVATTARLEHLLSLPADWDSYGAAPVDSEAATRALYIVANLSSRASRFQQPSIVPTVDGGIQLEWHTWHGDMEIEIFPGSKIARVFWFDKKTGIEQTFETSIYEQSAIGTPLDRLTKDQ